MPTPLAVYILYINSYHIIISPLSGGLLKQNHWGKILILILLLIKFNIFLNNFVHHTFLFFKYFTLHKLFTRF